MVKMYKQEHATICLHQLSKYSVENALWDFSTEKDICHHRWGLEKVHYLEMKVLRAPLKADFILM